MTAPQDTRIPYPAVTGLMLGIVLATLDGTVVGTALPTIAGELGGLDRLSWVVTAYLLTAAVTTPLWGKLGDLYGRKGGYLSAVAVFLAGSVLSGIAQTMGQLIAFRALQGVGAGGLMVGAFALIGTLVAPKDSARVQAVTGAMLPVAFAGGPLLGGFLTDHLNWRWAFYVNLPVGLAALLIVSLALRVRTPRVRARVDWEGALLLTTAVLALTLLAGWAGTAHAWTSPRILGLGALAAVALALFVRVERRAEEPVIPPRLFRGNFTLAQILSLLVGAGMVAAMNYLPQYLQFARGQSSTASGLLLLPLMLAMVAAQLASGRIIAGTGRYRIFPILGGALMTAGALALLLLDADTPTAVASALTAVLGAGMGFLTQATLLITMYAAEPRDMGAASGTVTLVRTLGGSLGVAVLGAVFTARLAGTDTHLTPAQAQRLPEPVRENLRAAVTDGVHGVLLGTALLAALALAVARFVREVPLRGAADAEADPGPAEEATEAAPGSAVRPPEDRPLPRPS
ncbi:MULTISPECIES: MDR family MFS transporter [unclassified Streptomyces]|uniref:MDR family MFS transporter n=1 Tax=unclassified Streptomyces TaxID=2593676 RepID=UPI0006F9CE49|nr:MULTISPECIES: MDR family MFS transporter [unclassified Streptomyces]KQX58998.1 transporter [Streptomyces sp. Root1304]KRB00259.1 transporter [Streptomyces sp. Root66D1]